MHRQRFIVVGFCKKKGSAPEAKARRAKQEKDQSGKDQDKVIIVDASNTIGDAPDGVFAVKIQVPLNGFVILAKLYVIFVV